MKRLLIIAPYFAPNNAADMQRVRMSLPFYKEFEWNAEIVMVNPIYSDMIQDHLFEQGIPKDIKIHYVSALKKNITQRIGLGSLAIRSFLFYKKKVNTLLKTGKYDLIYFSTTEYPLCILGPYWKKKFNIPFVIDMQDPWHSTYYLDKPKSQRPPKFWFSYNLNRFLEPMAMNGVDGIISVSDAYITSLKLRYKRISEIPTQVITFGYFENDFIITENNFSQINVPFNKDPDKIYLVYVGRGGFDMQPAIKLVLSTFKDLIQENFPDIQKIRFRFIGTSYAPKGKGRPTIMPIAEELNLGDYVEEITDRISFFESIKTMQCSNGLLIPGSNDVGYTASKLFPYVLARKPLLALFHPLSSAYKIIKECNAGEVVSLKDPNSAASIKSFLIKFIRTRKSPDTDWTEFEKFSAKNMTKEQCILFNSVIERRISPSQ